MESSAQHDFTGNPSSQNEEHTGNGAPCDPVSGNYPTAMGSPRIKAEPSPDHQYIRSELPMLAETSIEGGIDATQETLFGDETQLPELPPETDINRLSLIPVDQPTGNSKVGLRLPENIQEPVSKVPEEEEEVVALDDKGRTLEAARKKYYQDLIPAPDLEIFRAPSIGERETPIEIDSDTEDAHAAALFDLEQKAYDAKTKEGGNSMIDDVNFMRIRQAEDLRLKRGSKRSLKTVQSWAPEDDGLFFNEDDDLSIIGTSSTKRTKYTRSSNVPAAALQQAMDVGVNAMAEESANKTKKGRGKAKGSRAASKSRVRTPKVKDQTGSAKVQKPKGRKKKGPQMTSLNTLFHNDIVAASHANVGKEAQPGFNTKKKGDALKQLLAGFSNEERKLHTADKTALEKASRSFRRGTMKADGNNGWRLNGMRTSLYHYQLLGAAFMRDRENSTDTPHGGLQADDMGLGKTVTCLANMVDDRDLKRRNKTTLIVCPAGLCSQWLCEIVKHVEPETFGEVLIHRSGHRVQSTDIVRTLSNAEVIITSYSEVLRSYPHCDPPLHLVTQDAKTEWWKEHFNTHRGPLHQIFFRRIVLDEAQAIKNHLSKTSEAVRGLSGKHRWAISGTPVQNSLMEFYPFFAFLKVPHTGSLDTFRQNFAGQQGKSDMRLQQMLQKIMIRRTHFDSMFGRPLLQLPELSTKTVEVEFNKCERAIYTIIKARFVAKIRGYTSAGHLDKKYQHVFVLYLRLRQLVSHILLIQQTLSDLLEAEDLEKLWKITEAEIQPHAAEQHAQVFDQLRRMLSKARAKRADIQIAGDSLQQIFATASTENEGSGSFGLTFNFRKYLRQLCESGRWDDARSRALCHKCGQTPDDPHITSCLHIYCKECIEAMLCGAADSDTDMVKATCIACEAVFEKSEKCSGFEQAGTSMGKANSPSKKSNNVDGEDLDWLKIGGVILSSAKTLAVKAQVLEWIAEDPAAKIIIFTQFRTMLKILSRIMTEENLGCAQFHGGMAFDARDRCISDFASKPEQKVLLASLKAGGLGLNLTMASKVIILDLWFNESVEQQAFCRCYRIGQERPVDICRIVVKNTIDDELLKMQQRKTKEIDKAMKSNPSKLSMSELLSLFGAEDITKESEGSICDPFIIVEDEDENDDQSDGGVPTKAPLPPFSR